MNKLKFFFEKTKTSVKYLGTVALIISLSVMFSSLCVMSLLSLSDSIGKIMNDDPRQTIGADISIWSYENTPETFSTIKSKLEVLKQEGVVKEFTYTSVSMGSAPYYNLGDTRYLTLVGYEDNRFPLEGVKDIVTKNFSMKDLENTKDGAVLSKVVASKAKLEVGDTFVINSSDMYEIRQFKLIGIVDSPISSAYYIYVNKDLIEGDKAYTFYADGDIEKIKTEVAIALDSSKEPKMGTSDVDILSKQSQEDSKKFLTLIRGLSVLGLFVGSFGIASAVNTIVIKRRKEIGILKSIGFNKRDISTMLLLEVAIISVLGSIVGVVLGDIFFKYLINLISTSAMDMLPISTDINWQAVGLSLLVSILSSLIFAYISISKVADIKPIYALKDINILGKDAKRAPTILRFLVVGLIFCGISIFLTRSILYGLGAVALVAVAILFFSLIFRLIFFLILKIPIKSHNFVEFAWNNLKQSYKKIVFAMVAIFIGMFAVNFIATLVHSAKVEYGRRYREVKVDTNVIVTSLVDGESDDDEILKIEGVEKGFVMYKSKLEKGSEYFSELIGVNVSELGGLLNIVEGDIQGIVGLEMGNNVDYIVENQVGNTTETEDGKIITFEDEGSYKVGDIVVLINNGKKVEMPITGLYEMPTQRDSSIKFMPYGAYVSKDNFKKVVSSKYVKEYWLTVKRENYDRFYEVASKIPNILIASSFQIEESDNLILDTMVRFAVSIASLALLAGVILIIIVTVLDVTSRGRDFAIYKTLGFKQGEVTGMVLLEYGIMTVITSIFASLSAFGVSEFINRYGKELLDLNQKMYFDLRSTIIWNVCLIGLVLVLVFLVSRRPLRVRPTEVLRYE